MKEIFTSDLLNFLDQKFVSYKILGVPKQSYTLASLFDPIPGGFYFFNGEALPESISGSLVLAENRINKFSDKNAYILIKGNAQEFFYELSAVAADFVLLPLADAYNDFITGTA